MKPGHVLTVAFIVLLLAAALLTGCTTDADGTTRFDAAAFDTVVRTGTATYDRYRATPAPYYPPAAPMVNPYTGYPYPR